MIRILCVGRLKDEHNSAAAEYLKRMHVYGKVEVTELREQTDRNPEVGKRKEAQLILEKLEKHPTTYVTALDMRGKQISSEELSQLLRKPDITFIIGGPDGLSKEVLDEADMTLSLSKMTFPHQMARVILLEQIYRGYTILNGEKYHK